MKKFSKVTDLVQGIYFGELSHKALIRVVGVKKISLVFWWRQVAVSSCISELIVNLIYPLSTIYQTSYF